MRKNKRSPVVFIKKPTVVATQVALAVFAQLAYAQQQPVQTAERVERVEVTGSRIPTVEAEGASPITVMTQQEIRTDGLSKTEDLLNTLPQVYAAQGSNASNGATGTAQVNLRGLGPTRNLVLLNGRRLPPGSPATGGYTAYAADLNQIPAPLIQRVEVLTGGASAVYGSDAISGVVNFIMNDRFEGLQIDYYHSFYNHQQQNPNNIGDIVAGRQATNPSQFHKPDDVNADGKVNGFSVLMGRNFSDNKGNATLFLGYKKEDAVSQANRDFSACALNGGNVFTCGGSSTAATGRFTNTTTGSIPQTLGAGNAPTAFKNSTDLFNFGPYNYFRRPSEQYNMAAFAHLDVHANVRAYSEINFHDYHTDAVIAPSGVFGQVVTLSDANPLLTPAWKTALGIPAGGTANVVVQRRNVEGGGRDDDLRFTSFRGVVGAKGDLPGAKDINYDVFLQHGKVLYQEVYRNDFSTVRTLRALDVVSTPTGPQCRAFTTGDDPNCVPYNIWTQGGVTPAALNYLQTPGVANGQTEQTVYGLNFNADLAKYGVKLPAAKTGVGVSVGAERRKERLNFDTDVEFSTFDLAGQGGPVIGVNNKTLDVDEIFGEIRIPLIDNRRFMETLALSGSYRHSSYSTNKDTDTYGLGAEWAPVKMARFRGSYQHAVRHANIVELFQAQGTNLFEMSQDPCGASPTATLAQCQRSGIGANYGSALVTNPAGQYNYLQGGNADLKPETANTYTLGVVLTPLRNLTATIDYWSIRVEDAIGTPPPQTILNQCVFTGQFCNLVQRDGNGTLWLPNGGRVVATNQNLALYYVKGWDFSASYSQRIGSMGGVGVNWLSSYTPHWEYEPFVGLGRFDCAGLYGGLQCGNAQASPNPKWRHKVRGTWLTPWNVDLALTWRHIDAVSHIGTSGNPLLNDPSVPATDQHLAARDYFDFAFNWAINKTFGVRGGVNNIFDKDPPIVSNANAGPSIGGNGNTFPQTYDALGRLVFVNLTMKF